MKVLVYSDDASVRQQVVLALGSRPAPELPTIEVTEVATEPIVRSIVAAGGIDVIILDGEAVPAGGMGICRSLKEEIYQCPPVLLLTGRREDDWLARWSNAEATVQHPLDSIAVAHAVDAFELHPLLQQVFVDVEQAAAREYLLELVLL
jgi:DNA-binding response OmpR family regulator